MFFFPLNGQIKKRKKDFPDTDKYMIVGYMIVPVSHKICTRQYQGVSLQFFPTGGNTGLYDPIQLTRYCDSNCRYMMKKKVSEYHRFMALTLTLKMAPMGPWLSELDYQWIKYIFEWWIPFSLTTLDAQVRINHFLENTWWRDSLKRERQTMHQDLFKNVWYGPLWR